MSGKVFEENNELASKNCQKLYLNSITADVNFVFDDGAIKIPALKAILSVGSPVFHTMFYGSLPEKRDIPIADASAEAFKEFLQFFYLNQIRLTSEHIFEVANLCKKYEVNDGLKLCEAPMMQSLAINNMCTGYEVALLLDMKIVIEFCEREIKKMATEVLKSTDFLDCDHKILDKILKLVSSKCSASDVVDACMIWAKAKCDRENLEHTSSNLKAQLKNSFNRIPFADLDSEQFSQHTKTYKRFFVEDELEAIILKVMSSKKAKKNDLPPLRELICDRRLDDDFMYELILPAQPHLCLFKSNTRLLLTGFFIAEPLVGSKIPGSVAITSNGKELALEYITVVPHEATHVILSKPIMIDPVVQYGITFKYTHMGALPFRIYRVSKQVNMRDGIEINFPNGYWIITRLVFEQTIDP